MEKSVYVDVLDNLVYETINKYFKNLSYTGYKDYDSVNNILVLNFIHEITQSDLRYFLTAEDTKVMENVLYQLFGSTCEISFPTTEKCYHKLIEAEEEPVVPIIPQPGCNIIIE